ncbi:MAG: insulinase family protein, partial [Chloroflexi bacterium]|nr:insulinase family protein [Chloroflexota bacterium]
FVEVFRDHPARNLPIGNRQALNSTDRDVLTRFRDTYFVAGNMVVAVVGDVDHRRVIPRVAAAFEGLRGGVGPPTIKAPMPPQTARRVAGQSAGQQTRVVLGGPVPGNDNPDRYVLDVIDALLGPAGRRLENEIVDKRSLTSGIETYYLELTDVGLWVAQFGTRPDQVDEVLGLIRREVQALRDGVLVDADLVEAKAFIRGRRLLNRERSVDLAEELADGTVLNYYEPLASYLANVDAVTADDVRRVAAAHLDPAAFTVLVLAP